MASGSGEIQAPRWVLRSPSAAYFDRFPGVWHHGDFARLTANGGMVIEGRSDAVPQPGGGSDVRIVLFVCLRDGLSLDDSLAGRSRQAIRSGASPRHVPAVVAQVPSIPRTRSGKLVELAIRDAVAAKTVANLEAIDDPAALAHFTNHPALALAPTVGNGDRAEGNNDRREGMAR